MLENLSNTQVLAALMGLYFLAAGTGLFFSRDELPGMLKDLTGQPALGYLGGFIAFAVGGAIVAVHNDWSTLLAGVVSFVGWAALVEGVLMLACRKRFLGLFERMALTGPLASVMTLVTLAAGAGLLWAGLVA